MPVKSEEDFYTDIFRDSRSFIESTLTYAINSAECESPIERVLFAALFSWLRFGTPLPFVFMGAGEKDSESASSAHGVIRLYSQLVVGEYRVDFALKLRLEEGRETVFIIECDGHDFHERTKDQAAHDRAKDRKIQAIGYTIYRFTGREIWMDPWHCVAEIIREFLKRANRGAAE